MKHPLPRGRDRPDWRRFACVVLATHGQRVVDPDDMPHEVALVTPGEKPVVVGIRTHADRITDYTAEGKRLALADSAMAIRICLKASGVLDEVRPCKILIPFVLSRIANFEIT